MQYLPEYEAEHKQHKLEVEALRESRQTARVAKAESKKSAIALKESSVPVVDSQGYLAFKTFSRADEIHG